MIFKFFEHHVITLCFNQNFRFLLQNKRVVGIHDFSSLERA